MQHKDIRNTKRAVYQIFNQSALYYARKVLIILYKYLITPIENTLDINL